MKLPLLLTALLAVSACSTMTPLPDARGTMVRPLNPTKWDYEAALLQKQKDIGLAAPMNATEAH